MRWMQARKARLESRGGADFRGVRRCATAFLLSVCLLAGAPDDASAGSIGIQFDISQSWISILGGTIVVPPDGNLTSETLRVVVPGGTSATDVLSGAAIVKGLGLALTIDKDILGEAHVTGNIDVTQNGSAQGNLMLNSGNGTVNLSVLSLGLNLAIDPSIGCAGAGCSLIGTFPMTTPQNPILTGALAIGNIGQSGLATIDQTFSVTLSGVTAVVRLVGMEVKRTLVPEPASASLMGLGLLLAAAAGRGASIARRRF